MRLQAICLLACAACESVPVVLYHHVGEEADPPRWVSAAEFRRQMLFLRENGFVPITAQELETILLDGQTGPKKPVVLTFDDGYRDFFLHAYPILRELEFRATMFLITDRVGDDSERRVMEPVPHLVWPEILEMQAHGIEFQSHTVTHRKLREISLAEAQDELVRSRAILEERLGAPVTAIAYPFGVSTPDVRALVGPAGYRSAYSVGVGVEDRFNRLRMTMHSTTDLERFAEGVGGTWWGEASGAR